MSSALAFNPRADRVIKTIAAHVRIFFIRSRSLGLGGCPPIRGILPADSLSSKFYAPSNPIFPFWCKEEYCYKSPIYWMDVRQKKDESKNSRSLEDRKELRRLVHQVRDWYSGVAIKMGRRQGATKEHI